MDPLGSIKEVFIVIVLILMNGLLAMLEMALGEETPTFQKRGCGVNPLRRCLHCEENEALNRAADMAILSLWYKAEDTIADGGFLGRCGGRLLRAMLRRQYRRVAEKNPTVDAVFAGEMDRQRALEAAGDTNLDELCEPTAKMTAAMLSLLSEEPGERRVLERLGYLLGRYIYMADALDDWEKDKKHGDFNPFLQCEDEPEALKRHARASLLLTIGEMGAALDLLEADRTALRAGMEQAEAALHTAQQNYAAAKAAVDALRSQQAAAQSSAPAQPLETLREAAAELTAARDAARGQEKQLAARLLPNRRIMEQYRTAAAQHAALEQRAQWVGALAATAGGTLTSKQKIKLEAYIQMDCLDRILRHANLRLMQMTDAQYELERIGAENQRSQSGLDLGVIDHYNGTRRSVKTLSGGESFKASLALALGLSDEVQSAAGGIRLDTLFLDEGFGSLDEESLEQAIRVLAGLTEGDRLVGIISHVGALKDRIDRQVVVHKNRTGGSTVELVV